MPARVDQRFARNRDELFARLRVRFVAWFTLHAQFGIYQSLQAKRAREFVEVAVPIAALTGAAQIENVTANVANRAIERLNHCADFFARPSSVLANRQPGIFEIQPGGIERLNDAVV